MMKHFLRLSLAITVAGAGLSCGADSAGVAPGQTRDPITGPTSGGGMAGGRTTPTAGGGGNAMARDPNIPADAQYTIFCRRFGGPGHIQIGQRIKDELIRQYPQLPDWHLIIEDQQTSLYYGYYKEVDRDANPAEAARLAADRVKLLGLTDANGNALFSGSMTVPIPTPDPTAPPEWNLANSKGYWSVVIAAYTVPSERKAAAVEAVRAARAMGVEAYYYHGESISQVCIGSFPRDAVVAQQMDSAGTATDDKDIILSTKPLTPAERQKIQAGRPNATIVEPKLEIADPKLRAAMQKYDVYAVNGYIDMTKATDPRTGRVSETPKPSFLVEIPHEAPSLLTGNTRPDAQPGDRVSMPVRDNPWTTGASGTGQTGGRLRGIGQ